MDNMTKYPIGQRVKYVFRLGNESFYGKVTGYSDRRDVRVNVCGNALPNGWYRDSFWKPVVNLSKEN